MSDPWITKYIFPGAKLPSMKQLAGAIEKLFVLESLENIGPHYPQTLRAWYENFVNYLDREGAEQMVPSISGSSEVFVRMWSYYLLLATE